MGNPNHYIIRLEFVQEPKKSAMRILFQRSTPDLRLACKKNIAQADWAEREERF